MTISHEISGQSDYFEEEIVVFSLSFPAGKKIYSLHSSLSPLPPQSESSSSSSSSSLKLVSLVIFIFSKNFR